MPALSACAEQKATLALAARQVRPVIVSPATARFADLAHVEQTAPSIETAR